MFTHCMLYTRWTWLARDERAPHARHIPLSVAPIIGNVGRADGSVGSVQRAPESTGSAEIR